MALHVLDEANRCLGCKKPMCQEGCPIHTNIPEVIRLLKANQMDDAGRMLFENNPLTTVCSLVCNHENQCEGHCIRNRMPSHDPVHFSIIEDYISTTYANKMTAGPAPKNGMKAAVVGSGPAGLTIAVLLARWGYDVTIFDARDKIGGVMRYGIPNYRLPDSVLDDFQYRHLELKGIHVRPNTTIGKTITIDDLFRDGYKSVFIGAGLWKANAMHIKGESLGNVAFGIDYLANSKAFRLGDDIAVIGVGNSAMDCARTAIRNGARHVTCYARRDESCISASEYEVSYAKLEGVGFRFCKAPVEIRENGLICRDTVKGEDGKFTQVEGSETFYPHTGVIVSVSQGSESNLVKTTTGIETNQKGLLTVSEDGSTTREGVFAGGDAVTGQKFAIDAIAAGKEGAISLHRFVQKATLTIGRNRRQFVELDKENALIPVGFDNTPRQQIGYNEALRRTFRDERIAFTAQQVQKETARCLSCGASVVDPNKCIGCGVCTTKCAFDAIHLHRERPECSKMYACEDKMKAILPYMIKREFKIKRAARKSK